MNVWASWCIPCQEEAPELQKTQETLARHNATVLGVTYEDTAPDSIEFIHSNRLSYPDLRDNIFLHSVVARVAPNALPYHSSVAS
jgi:thiol-disulfide isomerase/thioredoxin